MGTRNAKQTAKTEVRRFKMHERLLFDVIQRQAGSLSKAILELVMNAADASATSVNITLDANTLRVVDDGEGFRSRKNIETFFEVFGQPHEENEHKTYGTFRMGRGQAMAFGTNRWSTGQFRMLVDIKHKGLDYELIEGEKNAPGCTIEIDLYTPLGLTEREETKREITEWCKYAPLLVLFDGELVSEDPAKQKWTHVTPEAYIRLKDAGSLSLYNLGVHTMAFPNHRFGCGGEVVSRQQLKVNFARNDVQSDCPVWRKIKPFVNKITTEKNINKKTLGDGERQRLCDQLRRGEIHGQAAAHQKLFTAVTGRHHTAEEFLFAEGYPCYTVAPKCSVIGDRVMKSKLAFVVALETVAAFGFKTLPELIAWARTTFEPTHDYYLKRWGTKPVKPFADVTKDYGDARRILCDGDLTPTERLWMQLARNRGHVIQVDGKSPYAVWGDTGKGAGRKVVVGEADRASAWTDGVSYVAINRKDLAAMSMDLQGIHALGFLLTHEACHGEDSFKDHDHDQAFYERCHDSVRQCLGEFVKSCLTKLPLLVRSAERKLTKTQTRAVDAADRAEAAGRKFSDKAAACH